MTTTYGLPAVTVTDPDGTDSPYVCRAVPAQGKEWRAWTLTKADSTVYRVAELPNGRFTCSCPHWKYRGRSDGAGCKHQRAIQAELTKPSPEVGTDEQHRPAGAGVPGEARRVPGARSG